MHWIFFIKISIATFIYQTCVKNTNLPLCVVKKVRLIRNYFKPINSLINLSNTVKLK